MLEQLVKENLQFVDFVRVFGALPDTLSAPKQHLAVRRAVGEKRNASRATRGSQRGVVKSAFKGDYGVQKLAVSMTVRIPVIVITQSGMVITES